MSADLGYSRAACLGVQGIGSEDSRVAVYETDEEERGMIAVLVSPTALGKLPKNLPSKCPHTSPALCML